MGNSGKKFLKWRIVEDGDGIREKIGLRWYYFVSYMYEFRNYDLYKWDVAEKVNDVVRKWYDPKKTEVEPLETTSEA